MLRRNIVGRRLLFEAADRVGVQEQFPPFLGSEGIGTVLTYLELEPFEAMLVQRVVGVGSRWEQGEMDLQDAGVLEHPGQAFVRRSPAAAVGRR
jgi:hypothetical protein